MYVAEQFKLKQKAEEAFEETEASFEMALDETVDAEVELQPQTTAPEFLEVYEDQVLVVHKCIFLL